MRLLHVGHDHVGRRPAQQKPQPRRRRDRPLYGRPYLPLRHLSANCRRHHTGGAADERRREMSDERKPSEVIEIPIELERYELFAAPTHRFNVDRREFFKLFGGGIAIVFTLKDALAQESGGRERQAGESGRRGPNTSGPKEIGGWLHIGEDGVVTVFTGKVEVGQDIRTSLTQAV